jgi:hypothetical protein
MASKPVAFVLAGLGVTKSHSRPRTSNDNPYSEAHVKTLKYRPDFPDRFGTVEQARAFCRTFFTWYNTAHRHSGIAWHTPHSTLRSPRTHRRRQRRRRRGPLPPPTNATPNPPPCPPPPGSTHPAATSKNTDSKILGPTCLQNLDSYRPLPSSILVQSAWLLPGLGPPIGADRARDCPFDHGARRYGWLPKIATAHTL